AGQVKTRLPPTWTTLSTTACTSVLTEAVLFNLKGSVTPEEQVAVFVIVPPTKGTTTIVAVRDPPLARLPRFGKVTAVPSNVKPAGTTDTILTPGGKTSQMATPVAVAGPRFVTVRV